MCGRQNYLKEGEKMAEYKVINKFQEKNHDSHVYEVGDSYPATNKKLVKARAEFLARVHSQYGVAFLEAKEVKKVTKEIEGDAE